MSIKKFSVMFMLNVEEENNTIERAEKERGYMYIPSLLFFKKLQVTNNKF